jgi:uncharacterized protein YkwD
MSIKIDVNTFIQDLLHAHNIYRSKHNSPPLVHNLDISKLAQSHADHLAKKFFITHSTNTYEGKPIGENLAFFLKKTPISGQAIANMWYGESEKFKYEDYQQNTGHFTQVLNDSFLVFYNSIHILLLFYVVITTSS